MLPLFGFADCTCSISATDWLEASLPGEPSWRSEDTVRFAGILAAHGVDFLDISTSGNHPAQRIARGAAYQVPFSEAVKRAHGDKILVGAVGAIYDGVLAESILEKVRRSSVVCSGGRTDELVLNRARQM